MRSARLEIVGVVKRAGTGEQYGGTGRVEHGVCHWEGWDMERLRMRVGQAIDLASGEEMNDQAKGKIKREKRT